MSSKIAFQMSLWALATLVMSFAVPVWAEQDAGTESLFNPIVFGPRFRDFAPTPDSTITDRQPTISVTIIDDGAAGLLIEEHLMIIPACEQTTFASGDNGVRINISSNVTHTFNLDLGAAGCTLPLGEIFVTISAVNASAEEAAATWSFLVNAPDAPPFVRRNTGPHIDRLNPETGRPGSTITVTGSGFVVPQVLNRFKGAVVRFDGEAVPTTVHSGIELSFAVPADEPCGSHTVQVINEGAFTVFGVDNESNVVGFVIPLINCLRRGSQIESLSPPQGGPGTQVTVRGSGFSLPVVQNRFEGARVVFNGEAIPTTVASATELTFVVPQNAPCGNATVQVSNGPLSIGGLSPARDFLVTECLTVLFNNPQPEPDSTINSAQTSLSVEVSTIASNGSIVASSIELALSSCPGRVFKTISGATFTGRVFAVNAAALGAAGCTLAGQVNVTVQARDTANNEGNFAWSFTAQGGNQSPTIELSFTPPNPQAGSTVNILADATDPDGDALSFQWFLNGVLQPNVTDNDGTISNITAGNHAARVVASDGQGHSAEDTILIEVSTANGNFFPIVSLSCQPNPVLVNQTFNCSTQATDRNNDLLTFRWFVNGNLQNANGPNVQGAFQTAGTRTIRVEVLDGRGGADAAEVALVVNAGPNGSPAPSPGPREPSVIEALDSNGNGFMEDAEVRQALAYWTQRQRVPGVDRVLDDCAMSQVIRLWVANEPISKVRGGECGALGASPAPSGAGMGLSARSVMLRSVSALEREVYVPGSAVLHVEVFDLQGRLVAEHKQTGSSLRLTLVQPDGKHLANGVYLYVVVASAADGRTWRSEVRKMTVLY